MSDKSESAALILKLYDLRREETMRKARDWFAREFFPETMADVMDTVRGPNGAYYRMVVSYWEMAASLVNNGAIDEQMFVDANGEHNFVFAKMQPFLPEMRAAVGPRAFAHLEKLVLGQPDAEASLNRLREMMQTWRAPKADATAS